MTDKSQKTKRLWPYLFLVPALIFGWLAGGILFPLGIGIFSETMLGIRDAALWLPQTLFFPLGVVGIVAGGVVGFLFVRAEFRNG